MERQPSFPNALKFREALQFPRFGVVVRLVRQMDEICPMPETITAANIADDWEEGCGVDLGYSAGPGGQGIRDRQIGLNRITQKSDEANKETTVVGTATYMSVVEHCLIHAQAIICRLDKELPAGLA
ncbi:hypothetical protein [Mycobacterium shimoidei]|uniref:hypothetical protein n=1 Tax=Mycobacterium shimoidei TaxID=29313 RepID=UPI00111C045A|nr:hypothetical protein [Mycobacterium shimoidei]MCV7259524.1 hypothetical protein [Mycobacterium shimoidei]